MQRDPMAGSLDPQMSDSSCARGLRLPAHRRSLPGSHPCSPSRSPLGIWRYWNTLVSHTGEMLRGLRGVSSPVASWQTGRTSPAVRAETTLQRGHPAQPPSPPGEVLPDSCSEAILLQFPFYSCLFPPQRQAVSLRKSG